MADPIDLCSLADVKAARRDSSSTLDTLTASYITRASSMIGQHVGREISPVSSSTARAFDVVATGDTLAIGDLSATPTAVTVSDRLATSTTTLTVATDVVALPRVRSSWEPIRRLRILTRTLQPDDVVTVTGAWGFPSIPPFVAQACVVTVVEWLRAGQALTIPSPDSLEPGEPPMRGLPRAATDLLWPIYDIAV